MKYMILSTALLLSSCASYTPDETVRVSASSIGASAYSSGGNAARLNNRRSRSTVDSYFGVSTQEVCSDLKRYSKRIPISGISYRSRNRNRGYGIGYDFRSDNRNNYSRQIRLSSDIRYYLNKYSRNSNDYDYRYLKTCYYRYGN